MAALSPGTRLGIYEVVEPIGAGGMGEVYRARDTELGRDVAIKVLPEDFAEDEERLARFRREAQVLASLNHPNIAAIYGTEQNALILELVEGPTLAERIANGPIPLDEAIAIARQIAEAVEAAHEAGVIHRDLKPANIKVQEDGTVKVLDFGLAKAIEGEADGSASESPTMTAAATRAGLIMGTAAYMSPEQARGKRVDRRADIWSFGVVVYEMLTGQRAFEAEDVSLTLAEVMKSEPDWDALPAELSPTLRMYLTRCLEKDPKRRVPDIGVLRLAMDGAFELPVPPTGEGAADRRWVWPAIVIAFALGSVVAGAAVWRSRSNAPRPLARFVLSSPSAPVDLGPGDVDLAITPDGSRIIYSSSLVGQRLVARDVNEIEIMPFEGLGLNASGVFVSPDGQWLGFIANGLRKVSVRGGPSVLISDGFAVSSGGASWSPDDTIILAVANRDGLWRVAAGGGELEQLTTPGVAGEAHRWPDVLPGGDAVLFTIINAGLVANAHIAVLSFDSGEIKLLVNGGSSPRYAASGHLVYGVGGTLRAVGFDLDRLEVTTDPVPVLEGVVTKGSGAADFAISQSGDLVYVSGSTGDFGQRTLVWVDRDGTEEPLPLEPRAYTYPRISPDGTRLAVDDRGGEQDIWLWDFGRETMTRLTFDPGIDTRPVWTPDGRRLVFASQRGAGLLNLHWKAADGTGAVERLTEHPNIQMPISISPDGSTILYWELRDGTGQDIGARRVDTDGSVESFLLTGPSNQRGAEISPDGRWIAYESYESGEAVIYVRPFPNVEEGRWQISRGSGTRPSWGPDGRELFYLSSGQLTAVPIQTNPTFSPGNPAVILEKTYYSGGGAALGRTYDISPDGTRFLMIQEGRADGELASGQIILVQNWLDELERLVPTDR